MKSAKITAVHGIGSLVGHAAVDVTLHPDTRFAIAFEDDLVADIVGAFAAAGALNLARKAKRDEKTNPPKPIDCARVGFFPMHSDGERIVVAATVRENVVIPLTVPRSSIRSMIENLQAIEAILTPHEAS